MNVISVGSRAAGGTVGIAAAAGPSVFDGRSLTRSGLVVPSISSASARIEGLFSEACSAWSQVSSDCARSAGSVIVGSSSLSPATIRRARRRCPLSCTRRYSYTPSRRHRAASGSYAIR
ncbi:MAG: hypothetical protein IPF99_21520 [Deltaproteobacteria bacterium]|nr:hypothetical protein [Deltaproteobacteria bacterium]